VRSIVSWSLVLAIFAGATDLISLAVGREVVVDFMTEAYSSAPPVLLFLALVLAAPLFEEIFFRGFLTSALESRGVSALVAAVIAAALWAAIHVQYDLYIIAVIFLGGLLLAAARIKTGSLVPCVVMHGLLNAIAFAETAYFAEAR
jgi:membrane protease YdiL (CAAX protease family)